MNHEANRLQTFQNWPENAPISPNRLAKAGFYYSGQAQTVQCFLCGITVSEWNYTDQAISVHRLASPDCPFVLDPNTTCNIPMLPTSNDSARPSSRNTNHRENSEWGSIGVAQRADLARYSVRLSTFENWPIPNVVSPERLARSGFFYLQEGDMVECAYCQGLILKWEPGDDPDREHRTHFPDCDFYLRTETDSDLSAEKVELASVKLMPGTNSNLQDLGIQEHSAPRQQKYATYESRLHTFSGWPTNLKQTPEMLADAGFYYVGQQDQVRCFHCDGGLRNWEETDDVWIEHAKWFPQCGYINIIKGHDFIKHCIDNRPSIDQEVIESVVNENAVALIMAPPRSENPFPLIMRQDPPIRLSSTQLRGMRRRLEQQSRPSLHDDEEEDSLSSEEDITRTNRATPDSPSAELTSLMNQVITSVEAASSSSNPITHPEKSVQIEPERVIRRRRPPRTVEVETQVEEADTKTDKTVSLEEENRRLKEARQCKICMDREVAVVFLPCSHLSTCLFCAPSLTYCPLCRQEIRATVRTFLA